MSRQGIFFDYDGTLIDNIGEIHKGVCNVFMQSGLLPPTIDEFCSNYQTPYMKFYRERGVRAPEEVMVKWFTDVSKHQEQPFFPDVAETLEVLKVQGYILVIISANYKSVIEARCKEANISQFFSMIVGRSSESRRDFKAKYIKAVCSTYGTHPTETKYVGDFISDMRDGSEAGVIPVGITQGKKTAKALFENGAHMCVDTLSELTLPYKN